MDKDNNKNDKQKDKNMLEIFRNEKFGEIRTMVINERIWFVGKDIADALGYSEANKAITNHIDEDDRLKYPIIDNLGRTQEMWAINESGLYSLILSSKLSQAKEFKRWITSEVLPCINKYGAYMTDMTIEKLADNPDLVIELATKLKKEREITKKEREKNAHLQNVNKQQNQIIAELQPKATYYDLILQCKDLISISQIAKDYGKSAKWFNDKLHELGIQYKHRDTWLLYAKFADKGYTSSKTVPYTNSKGELHSKLHTYWSQKGRLFLYHTLKNHNILPLIEQEEI